MDLGFFDMQLYVLTHFPHIHITRLSPSGRQIYPLHFLVII